MEEDFQRMEALAEGLGVPPGPNRWYEVALRLARKHEPSLRPEVIRTKWSESRLGVLVVEIERITGDPRLTVQRRRTDLPKISVSMAADQLVRQPMWSGFLQGGANPAEALRTQYSKAHTQPLARVARKAFKLHTLQDNISGWDEFVRGCLSAE